MTDPIDPRLLADPEPPSRVVSLRLPNDLADELVRRADEVDRSLSWYCRNALQVTIEGLNRVHDGEAPEGPLAEQWGIAKQAGMGGHTYEVGFTFLLPPIGEPDYVAFDIRDQMIHTAYQLGARDVVSRIISLCGMADDKRIKPVHAVG
jgi:hypothetical protein